VKNDLKEVMSESTLQAAVEGNGHDHETQRDSEATSPWWFGPRDQILLPRKVRTPASPATEQGVRSSDPSTLDPQGRNEEVSALKPVARPRPFFGRRGFLPVYQWEGVVEEVNGEGFRARLRPLEGEPDPSQVEYADFDYMDLADDSDHELVVEGAVFYWTVGRSRNVVGTQTNTSLVRFRRLPPPSARQLREAEVEAEAMLADLRAGR
jgi:hypothetical protein